MIFQLRSQENNPPKAEVLKFYPAEWKEVFLQRGSLGLQRKLWPKTESLRDSRTKYDLIARTPAQRSHSHAKWLRCRDAVSSCFRSGRLGLWLPCSHQLPWFHADYAVALTNRREPSGLFHCCDALLCLWQKAENASSCLCAF